MTHPPRPHLLGGDTLHVQYKLPLGTLFGKRCSLSDKVLKRWRREWTQIIARVIDEISVVAPGSFFQMDARTREITGHTHAVMGGLTTGVY